MSYTSQFELPVLFYVLTILAMYTKHADILFVVMAWLFVLARVAACLRPRHQQQPQHARPVFGIGAFVLVADVADLHRPHLLGLP